LCQRYFTIFNYDGAAERLGVGGMNNTSTARIHFPITTTMRATPTLTTTNVTVRESNDANRVPSSQSIVGTWPGSITVNYIISGGTAGSYAELRSSAAGETSFDAEL